MSVLLPSPSTAAGANANFVGKTQALAHALDLQQASIIGAARTFVSVRPLVRKIGWRHGKSEVRQGFFTQSANVCFRPRACRQLVACGDALRLAVWARGGVCKKGPLVIDWPSPQAAGRHHVPPWRTRDLPHAMPAFRPIAAPRRMDPSHTLFTHSLHTVLHAAPLA